MANSKTALTPAQRKFADLLISGIKPSRAYSQAYPNSSLQGGALAVEAHRTTNLPKVQAYVGAALATRRSDALLTRDKKRQILGGIAQDEQAPDTARIAAIKVDNEMTGDNAPVRIEGEITLHAIFSALLPSTGLPSAEEKRMLKIAHPVGAPKTRDHEAPATTAMERAG